MSFTNLENQIILLRGNKSREAFSLVTERFRCRSLASVQDRYQRFLGLVE
mgnify:CR=1 FL=1